jgi:hypothetical protein
MVESIEIEKNGASLIKGVWAEKEGFNSRLNLSIKF